MNVNLREEVQQYHRAVAERNAIIRENRARRMRAGEKMPPLPVPPMPERPRVLVAYAADGTYEGVIGNPDECPDGCHVRMEPAI